jgi:Ca2+-binding RTX toxin-like protein
MSATQELLNAAVLAEAAYLDVAVAPGTVLSGGDLDDALLMAAAEANRPFSATEAQFISSRYDLVASSIASGVGFQALVFRKHNAAGQPGEYVLAIRGTDSVVDVGADIALLMLASAGGQNGALLQFVDSLTRPLAQGGYGLTLPDGSLDATGHSLGGHLVQALASARPELLHAGYTFNGVGLGVNLTNPAANIALALRAAWEWFGGVPTNVTNVIGEAGLEVVPTWLTGPKVGDIAEVFTEKQTLPWQDHYMAQLVDSLIVFRAFEALVGTAQFELDTVSTILRAASATPTASLETVMNALASLFPASGASSTIAFADRGGLHQSADRLTSHLTGPGGTGGSYDVINLLQSSTQLAAVASQDDAQGLAYRYALVNAVPFVVGGVDYAALFNGTGRYDATNFSAEYLAARAQYLAAQFDANTRDLPFSQGIAPDLVYRDLPSATTLGNVTLPDVGNSRQVVFGDDLMDDTISGGDLADQLFGGGGNDTLEGGAGNDLLDGGAGGDILKGGQGVTTARGGLGNDTYRYYSGDGLLKITDTLGSNQISINLNGGDLQYMLGNTALTQVSGSSNAWTDTHNNRFSLTDAVLYVLLEDGGQIAISDFTSGDFGITLAGPATTTPAGTTYDVGAPDQSHGYPPINNGDTGPYYAEINAVGAYGVMGWSSAGSYFHRLDSEIINVSTALGDPPGAQYSSIVTNGGMGDSYITGDDGPNTIRDDSQAYWTDYVDAYNTWGVGDHYTLGIYPLTASLALGIRGPNYNMAPVMGNDLIRAGGGDDVVYTSGGDDTVYGGEGDDVIWDAQAGAEARSTQSYTYNGVTAQGVTYFYGYDTEWVKQPGHSSNDKLLGEAGSDSIWAHGGNQIMDGGADDDTLVAGAGDDILIGGTGNDALAGDVYRNATQYVSDTVEYGIDILNGGDGNDTLYGGGGADVLMGGIGDDTLDGDFRGSSTLPADPDSVAGDDNIFGDAGADTIYGGGEDDTIDGGTDDDTVYGGSGNDFIVGGGGMDTLFGDDVTGPQGNDEIQGGDQGDTIYGGGNNDSLYGDSGADALYGGSGDDVIDGGSEDDILNGDGGNDSLSGGLGHDELYGGDNNDQLAADSGSDLLAGGAGNDTYLLRSGAGHVTIADTEGSNNLWFDASVNQSDIRLRMAGGAVYIDFSATDYVTMDAATFLTLGPIALGASTTDTLSLGDLRKRFEPAPLSDGTLQLASGVATSDIAYTSQNDDLILIYSGTATTWVDTSTLSARNVMFQETPGSWYGQPAGTRALVLNNWYRAASGSYVATLADTLGGNADLTSLAAGLTRQFVGTSGTDTLTGTTGADSIFGLAGSDLISALDGNDYISGGAGGDVLVGGLGNDTYQVNTSEGGDIIIDGGGTADFLSFGAGITPTDISLSESSAGLTVLIGGVSSGNKVLITNQSSAGGQARPVEYVAFADGTVWNATAIDNHMNHAPAVTSAIPDQYAHTGGGYSLQVDNFHDPDAGDQLLYAAQLSSGQSLPSWLVFDSATHTFTGTPPTDSVGALSISVTVTDTGGLSATAAFQLAISLPGQATPGNDTLTGTTGIDAIDGLAGDDAIYGFEASDVLSGSPGNDYLDGGTGADSMSGGSGNDTFVVDDPLDVVIESPGEGTDLVLSSVTYTLASDVEDLTLTGSGSIAAAGNALDNVVTGNSGSNVLDGGAGADSLRGGAGNDTYLVDGALDVVAENAGEGTDVVQSSVTFTLSENIENLTMTGASAINGTGNGLANTIRGNSADNVLDGGVGSDVLIGGIGDDTYIVDSAADSVTELASEGTDLVQSTVDYVLGSNLENLTLIGTAVRGTGNTLDNVIVGNGAANTLYGGAGADMLAGGAGNDTLIGGSGNNTYLFARDDGQDIISSHSDSASGKLNTLQFAAGIASTDLVLNHDSYYDLVIGIAGTTDSIAITSVNDPLTSPVQQLRFADGTVLTLSYAMAATDTSLVMTAMNAVGAVGNDLINTITGTALGDYIDGGKGADVLSGGAGEDTYVVDTKRTHHFWEDSSELWNFLDTVNEVAGEGYDTIQARGVYSATLPANVERLIVTGALSFSASFNLTQDVRRKFTGNALDNVIDASAATGGALGVGYAMSDGTPLGRPLDETVIDGGSGADLMTGPATTTRFVVDNVADVVVGHSAITRIDSSISYTLEPTFNDLTLVGSSPVSGTGNALNNVMDGAHNAAANVLAGGLGNDTYSVGAGDSIVEAADAGIDSVFSGVGFTLPDNVENLTLTGSGSTTARGNALDNAITGTDSSLLEFNGHNYIVGGGGNDQLRGGSGNDVYADFDVTTGLDIIVDSSGSADKIQSVLNSAFSIEQLQFSRSGSDLLIAVDAANSIRIQSWYASPSNVIESLAINNDGAWYGYSSAQMQGRADGSNTAPAVYAGLYSGQSATTGQAYSYQFGVNTFVDIESQHSLLYTATLADGTALPSWLSFDSATRTFSGTPPTGSAGSVSIKVIATDAGALSASTTFGLDIEPGPIMGTPGNDLLVGDASDNAMEGLGGDDSLDGQGGNDSVYGGLGNDTMLGGAGDDYLDDWGADGYGGNDYLDGGTGADMMYGGDGNDIYIVDNAGDIVFEDQGGGTDEVRSSVTFTLDVDLDNLTLTGTSAINGTGNALDNVLSGNSGNNTLTGLAGNDTLYGGTAGTDALVGGTGNDSYTVGRTTGITITENANEGTDLVSASVTYTLGSNLENLALTGTSAINGTGNTLANVIAGNGANNALNGGTGADTMIGGAGNDTYTVDNAGDVVTENASEGTDLVKSSVIYTIGADVENLTLTGTTAISGAGNTLNNVLTGNSGNNTLTGLAGNDTLYGGSAGADVLVGGTGDDTYTVGRTTGITITENAGEGTDLVNASVTHTLGNNVENLTLTGTTAINGAGNTLNNVLTGNSGKNTLTGLAGNDTLYGGTAGTDVLVGGTGNDTYTVDRTTGITVTENAGEGIDLVNASVTHTLAANIDLLFLTGASAINGTGNALANLLRGNVGVNTLVGGGGTDILEGGDGNDILSDVSGNTLLNGGLGADTLTGTANNDLLIGGAGNDALTTGSGADIIVFNKGDGQDTVAASTTKDNTLAVGGGTLYADLLFQKSGNDLILKVGASDQITFTGYYVGTSNRSVNTLQVVIEGTSDYNSGSPNAMNNKKVEIFNFDALVTAFDAARTADPNLTSWALTSALAAQYLSGSDTAALGGDLTYQYARNGSLSNISFTPALGVLAAAGFGSSAQTLQSLPSLQDSTARLS